MRKPGWPKGKPRKKPVYTPLDIRSAIKSINAKNEDKLAQVLELVKQTDSRSRVLFQKVHNLQVSFDELTKRYDGILALLKELFDRPDQLSHAEHIVSDFLKKKYRMGAS